VGRRLTRKQIKRDEFVTFVDKIMQWMSANWRRATIGFSVIIGLGLVYWGVTAAIGSRASGAAAALDRALEIYEAPVGAAAPADAKVKFDSETAKLDAAANAFKRVSSHYWLTSQATTAKLYLARIDAQRGDVDAAIRTLSELASRHGEGPVVRVAMLDLIDLRIAKSDAAALVPQLEAMAAGKDSRLPPDLALYLLARISERSDKREDAKRFLQQLIQDYPDSPYRTEAQQRLSALG
jgi:tetratricopeptide (TPR) repeat protein